MNVLVISADSATGESMAVAARSVGRTSGRPVQFLRASNGVDGIALAWRHLPDVVVADEIASRAGAFAVARDLKGADPPFPGKVIILLDRAVDQWLAAWSGADAWFVKPVNPFELADALDAPREEAV